MTVTEAIRLLNPETTAESIVEIEYYNGFSGKKAAIQAITESTIIACEAMEKQIPIKPNGAYCPMCKRHLRCPKQDIGCTGKVKNRKGDGYCPSCGQAIDWGEQE